MVACDRETFGRRVAADNVGPRKNLPQVRHAAADAATEIEDCIDLANQLLCELDFITGKIVAVAVEEIRLRRENGLVLPGILVEIDTFHAAASCQDKRWMAGQKISPSRARISEARDTRTKIINSCVNEPKSTGRADAQRLLPIFKKKKAQKTITRAA